MVEEALFTRIPPAVEPVKVWRAVQVLGLARLREAITLPVVGEMVNVPSEFATDETPVTRHELAIAKHPEDTLTPFANVDVPVPCTLIIPLV